MRQGDEDLLIEHRDALSVAYRASEYDRGWVWALRLSGSMDSHFSTLEEEVIYS
jgi:hypothetical protein